jgi:hypothetical protein
VPVPILMYEANLKLLPNLYAAAHRQLLRDPGAWYFRLSRQKNPPKQGLVAVIPP